MTIAHVESSDKLNLLVRDLGEHSDEESDAKKDESTANLQENYKSLLEKSGEYTRISQGSCEKNEEGRGGL